MIAGARLTQQDLWLVDLQSYWICILTAEDLCDPHLAVLCVSLQQVTLIHPPSNGGSGADFSLQFFNSSSASSSSLLVYPAASWSVLCCFLTALHPLYLFVVVAAAAYLFYLITQHYGLRG